MTKYCFVIDRDKTPLSPTKEVKAWYMLRAGKARLISKYPMVIQLIHKVVYPKDICQDKVLCGIDDGSLYVGIALMQQGQTKNKVLFKGTIHQRNDVSKRMTARKEYRSRRRFHKRYRAKRFRNRGSSKRPGRIPPSILQKKQAILRVIDKLRHWIPIHRYSLEDAAFDIRALTDGYTPYPWQYRQSNRLDENIRKAVILRDKNRCRYCGKTNGRIEVHHIKPRRWGGSNTLSNLISLCEKCHAKIKGIEEQWMDFFYGLLERGGDRSSLRYAQHVMQGKTYLRTELMRRGELSLTTGGDTANRRIDLGIEKSHSNDAICITGRIPDTIAVPEYEIRPIRRKRKTKTTEVLGIRHRDLVSYTYKNEETHVGYVTALYSEKGELNFQSRNPQNPKHCKRVNAKKCKRLWSFTGIYWFAEHLFT